MLGHGPGGFLVVLELNGGQYSAVAIDGSGDTFAAHRLLAGLTQQFRQGREHNLEYNVAAGLDQ